MPLCPGGTRPKDGTPTLIVVASTLITALVGSRFPPAVPFLSAAESLLLDTGVLCAGDPPPWPTFTAADFVGLASGTPSENLVQAVQNAAWYQFCTCVGSATPLPPTAPPVADMPAYPPGTSSPCAVIHVEFTPDPTNLSGTYNVIGTPTAPRWMPSGTKWLRLSAIGVDPGNLPDAATTYAFTTTLRDAAGAALNAPQSNVAWEFDHWVNDITTYPIQTPAVSFNTTVKPNLAATGPFNPNAVVTFDIEMYCDDPATLSQACCPPDPAVLAKLTRLEDAVQLLLDALAPPGDLVVIGETLVSGEGSVALLAGCAQLNLQLDILGGETQLVPYANPDRVMRAGTVRLGNDFGWRRREHVDAQDWLLPVPPDATVASWSLSPGTSGRLIQLGRG